MDLAQVKLPILPIDDQPASAPVVDCQPAGYLPNQPDPTPSVTTSPLYRRSVSRRAATRLFSAVLFDARQEDAAAAGQHPKQPQQEGDRDHADADHPRISHGRALGSAA